MEGGVTIDKAKRVSKFIKTGKEIKEGRATIGKARGTIELLTEGKGLWKVAGEITFGEAERVSSF